MKEFKMLVNAEDKLGHIRPEIYGHFSEHLGRCIYGGIYVGEDSPIPNIHGIRKDVVEAFKNIRLPVLRWPGGCFADEYHWKDGIGEKSTRKRMVNTNWGGVVEDNSFGTHEFMELCELVGCEPYIAGNVGSGTVRELSEWVEYMTFDGVSPMAELRRKNGREKPWKFKYLGIGNENWGCGGNMTPEFYAGTYNRFRSFCKNYSGNELYYVACGPNSSDYNWTEVMMKNLRPQGWWTANAISLHFYSIPDWNNKGLAAEFDDEGYYTLLNTTNFTDELLTRHTEIMNRYDPEGKVALFVDEWGTWFDVEPGTNPGFLFQQNTMRDAVAAAISLNTFNRHSKRVKMANIAQAVNVLQALKICEETCNNAVIGDALHDARQRVTDGTTISGPLAASGVFPRMMTDMLAVGEQAGDMVSSLEHIGKRYQKDMDRNITTFTNALEPILIVAIAGVVGFVAIAILMAVFKVSSSLG